MSGARIGSFSAVGFGDRAVRWASRLRATVPVIACEPAQAPAALGHALELRRAGYRFLVSIDLPDARAVAYARQSAARVPEADSVDGLRLALDAFSIESLTEAAAAVRPVADIGAVSDLLRLSHGVVCSSSTTTRSRCPRPSSRATSWCGRRTNRRSRSAGISPRCRTSRSR